MAAMNLEDFDLDRLLALLGPNRWLQALIVLGAAWLLAHLAKVLLTRLVPRLTRRTRTDLDDRVVEASRHPVFITVLIAGAHIALLRLATPAPYDFYAQAILKTVVILAWTIFLVRLARLVLGALSSIHERFTFIQPQTLPALANAATAAIAGGGIYFLLLAWNIDVSGWLASAGIVGLAVSLAAKDTLANLFAGLSLVADAPFKVGDFVILESGERGEVTRIGIRSSRIQTRDDVEVIVPNSVLANTKIINEAGGPSRHYRVRVKVSVAYGSDIDEVRRLLLEIAAAEEMVLDEPAPRVRFRSFGDSGLAIELLCWVPEPVLRGRALDALNTSAYKRFAAAGIEIPYPRRHVYLQTLEPPV